MTIKKKLTILLVGALSICLFFAFSFQIDVGVVGDKTGGTAEVLLEPLRIAANEANAAVEAAQITLEEAQAAQAALQLIDADPDAAVEAAKQAVIDSQIKLDELLLLNPPIDDPNLIAAKLELKEAQETLAALELIVTDLKALLITADKAVTDAQAALDAALLAAEEANAAFSGFKAKDEEDLEELEQEIEKIKLELEEARIAGDEEKIAELEQKLDKAIAALEDGESGVGENTFFHIITNSNNGGSFDKEGNYSGVDGDSEMFTFTAEEGFELAWLRVGNQKISPSDLESLFEFSFNKKNLTIHAHFKKDKDYSPEITTEETNSEEGEEPGDDVEDEKGKSKNDEKSNNGKNDEKRNNGKKNKKK